MGYLLYLPSLIESLRAVAVIGCELFSHVLLIRTSDSHLHRIVLASQLAYR